MERIELGDFLLIAEAHTGIDAHQLTLMPRVPQLAESALAAPFAGFGDFEAYPALHQKAAIYCSRIVRYRPLPDGNKRTGYDVMREFIDRNNSTFTHPDGSLDATAQAIEDLAA
ncbi:MAG: Fic family protein [Solirubrobacteraceae bacterium]